MTEPAAEGAWRRVLDLTVEPIVPNRRAEDRRLGRLVAATALAFVTLGGSMILAYLVAPGVWVASIEFATMIVCVPGSAVVYVLARRGAPRLAAWILIVMATAAVFFLVFADIYGLNPIYHPTDGDTLAWMVLPIFVASVVLSRRAAIIISSAILIAMLAVPALAPVVAWGQFLWGPWLLVAGASMLTIIFAGYRERQEQARTARLVEEIEERRTAQDYLARNRDALEVLVAERTHDLEAANAELVQANQAKSRFLANMSHELRTPLNSIIGFTGIMKQGMAGPLTDEQARQLGMVDSSSRQLLQLINQLLDLSRIESGHETIHLAEFDLDELLDELRDLVEPLAVEKGLSITVERDSRSRGQLRVNTDRVKVRQILVNLLGNAVKFTETGGITIAGVADEDALTVVVSDTGAGIPPESLDSVFEEYQQVAEAGAAKPEGTGLGLTVSLRLAQLLGGGITVTSTAGEGSTFTVTVPSGVSHA
jgi:signal transduction histidine kinase